jgi:hypothetical protein
MAARAMAMTGSSTLPRHLRDGTGPTRRVSEVRPMKIRHVTLVAAALAAALLGMPTAHAAGPCADLFGPDPTAYYQCVLNAHAQFTSSGGLGVAGGHTTSVYPDGGRDECDYHGAPGLGSGSCQYFPPGS